LFWVASISISLIVILICYYYRKLTWKIKIVTFRLNKIIHNSNRDKKVVRRLLKELYTLVNKSIANNDATTAYQVIDLLKLAFGYGVMRQDESARLMALSIAALNKKNPDIVSFILDSYRPLIRQLSPEDIPAVAEHLTVIGVIALKQKENFLVAKVTEIIFLITDRADTPGDKTILIAILKAFKVIGVFSLRRRDIALFREISVRFTSWFITNHPLVNVTEEIIGMLVGWLHRIIGMNDPVLLEMVEDCAYNLIDSNVLVEESMELLFAELGNLAASACLNPNSILAGSIISFLFTVASREEESRHWTRVVAIAGRVIKLAVSCHGIIMAFMIFYPMLEIGRTLLWSELRFVQCIDEARQEMLFAIVKESLIIISFAAKQDLIGSPGQTIVEIFKCWVEKPGMFVHHKSIKKYCQLLLFFWLKDKRQAKKYMPHNNELIEPMLFSDSERIRFRI
jgi:hypothetical protein